MTDRKNKSVWLGPILVVTDGIVASGAYVLAFFLRFRTLPPENMQAFEHIAIVISVFAVLLNWLYGMYEHLDSREEMLAVSLTSSFMLLVLAMSISFFLRAFALPRSVILLAWPLHALLFGVIRLGSRIEQHSGRPQRHDRGNLAAQTVMQETAAGREVLFEPDLVSLLLSATRVVRMPDGIALALSAFEIRPHQRILHRVLDLVVATVGLAVAVVVLVPVAVSVVVDSGFPLFYSQERVGQGERMFRIYKIRTMRRDAEDSTGVTLATEDDDRVTRVGRFLRASRLDELPQLWNVLCGEMSVVGPRPERPELHERFKRTVPGYVLRTLARPGLTGLAQVYGTYTTEPSVKLQYDLIYIFKYSLGLDLFVMLRTPSVLLQPSRARGAPESQRATRSS